MIDAQTQTPSPFAVKTFVGEKPLPPWLINTVNYHVGLPGAMGPYVALGTLMRYAVPADPRMKFDAWLALQGPGMASQAVAEALRAIYAVQAWLTDLDVMNLLNHPDAGSRISQFLRYRDDLESLKVLLAEHPDFLTVRSAFLLQFALEKLDAAAQSHKQLWATCPVEVDGRAIEAERLKMNHWWFKL